MFNWIFRFFRRLPSRGSYDVAFQAWLQAKERKNFRRADKIRTRFERDHGLTLIAVGKMPIEGVTTQRMLTSVWEKKYGNSEVGRIIKVQDSKVKQRYPGYSGSKDLGYHV